MTRYLLLHLSLVLHSGLVVAVDTKPEGMKEAEVQEKAPPVRVERTDAGESVLSLNRATMERLKLRVEPLKAVTVQPRLRAFATVVDPGPLSDLLVDLEQSEVAAKTSSMELKRQQGLRAQDNASQRALEQAEAAAMKDGLTQRGLQNRLRLLAGSEIRRVDLDRLIPGILQGTQALVRVEFESGEGFGSLPPDAELRLRTEGEPVWNAKLLGRLPSAGLHAQSPAAWYVVSDIRTPLPVRLALTANLPTGGDGRVGVEIPRSSILRVDGRTWVLVQTGERVFIRREIELVWQPGGRAAVLGGLKPGEAVVVEGAPTLLSAEILFRSGGGGSE